MIIDSENLLNSIRESFANASYIKSEDIPNIDLYMDQVTAFLDEKLKTSARNPKDEERLVTKTMINNYAKNDVIPPPEKKKYTKDHILLLIFLYYFKSILSLDDIKTMLGPIIDNVFGGKSDFEVSDIYGEIFDGMPGRLDKILEDVIEAYDESIDSFDDAPDELQEYLKKFYFVGILTCDVFVKKLLIEKTVDSLKAHNVDSAKNGETE